MLFSSLLTTAFFLGVLSTDSDTLETRFHALLYQAEVHGKVDESIAQLQQMLGDSIQPEEQKTILRVLSLVKKQKPLKLNTRSTERLFAALQDTRAIILSPPFAYLFTQGVWLELGDWVGPYRVMEIGFSQIQLENDLQEQRMVTVPSLARGEPQNIAVGSKFIDAPVGEILGFATKKLSLNFFFPSAYTDHLEGFFPESDWQGLIDQICTQSQIIWTRRMGSIVFEPGHIASNSSTMIRGIDTRNRNLGSLLQEIADIVGLELILFDESLNDVAIDLYLADQPWNEALDCLSMMTGFNWAMVPQEHGSGQLVVTRN